MVACHAAVHRITERAIAMEVAANVRVAVEVAAQVSIARDVAGVTAEAQQREQELAD
jgi:hypothetical protein